MSPVIAGATQARQAPAGGAGFPRLLPPPTHVPNPSSPGADLRAYLGLHGPVPYRDRAGALIGEVRAAGLTGRGGRAVLYVRGDLRARTRLDDYLPERDAYGLDRLPVEIVWSPHRFLAGEESALASRVSGGPAVPQFTPPRVFERGVDGRPTLVQNVETLAHLALIARYGPGWFRALGTPDEPGSMLCTLRQASGSVDVAEAAIGTPLAT